MSTRVNHDTVGTFLGPAGSGLTTTYSYSPKFCAADARWLDLWITAAIDALSSVTAIECKLQSSEDGTNWIDEYTVNSGNNTAAIDQSLACTAGATKAYRLRTENARLCSWVRVAARTTGATVVGDVVTVKARAWE